MTDIEKEPINNDHIQRTGNQQRQPDIIKMEITSVLDVSPTVKHLILLTTVKPVPISFKAGQWVDMMIPGIDTIGGYSIVSTPAHLSKTGELSLCVKNSDHPPAHWVHNECKPGSIVSIRVGGDFFLDNIDNWKTGRNILLVAGGVGINPLFSMIAQMNESQRGSGKQIVKYCLMYSAKTNDEFLFKDSLDHFALRNEMFSVEYFLTDREQTGVTDASEKNVTLGRITKAEVERCLTNNLKLKIGSEELNQTTVYLCGPPPMIENVLEILGSLGIDNVLYEKWW